MRLAALELFGIGAARQKRPARRIAPGGPDRFYRRVTTGMTMGLRWVFLNR